MSSETFILLMSDDWSRFPDLGSGFREALSWRIILAQTDLQVVINSSFRADRGQPGSNSEKQPRIFRLRSPRRPPFKMTRFCGCPKY
jgi:hypothetical protein